ncbi:hypothetical protein PTRA_a2579 [Pseudoalteromonas translucida KMM 520]|uniref:Spore coat protein U domain-containing protein n=1 Tax=Pseudoalteromonas translucida KMM 520 TaxID=1315283 RepID=A0A0U2VJN5_9GAMM|nr:hypothetical protein [Pseudoalteromonas translucida]ALS33653.1 hypothetical protein PTRA_a2579 [Pseudoalteromonas translucida KMM 520]
MKEYISYLLCCLAFNAYSNDEVALTLVGYISPKCEFTTDNNNLTFSSEGFANTELVINCNSPMRVSMLSENGGLRHQQSTHLNAYNVNLSIADANQSLSVSAQTLKVSQAFNINKILFNSIAKLQLELVDPLIYAGEYRDVIRIEMTPSVVSGGVR